MPNRDLLIQFISKLQEYLDKLKFLQKYSKQEFLKDWQIEVQVESK